MSIEYDEKGKFYTDIISKVAVPVTMQTTNQLIKGFVHVRHGERIKDELDRDELFLAVTNARILEPDSEAVIEAPFIAVRRAQIVWIMPDEEAGRKDTPA
ncbi:MAG: hypothetical protein AB1649_03170 [Chloroflexota bacterium]